MGDNSSSTDGVITSWCDITLLLIITGSKFFNGIHYVDHFDGNKYVISWIHCVIIAEKSFFLLFIIYVPMEVWKEHAEFFV